MKFQAIRCPNCNTPVMEAAWKGLVRVRCHNRRCHSRLLIIGNGNEYRVTLVDRAPNASPESQQLITALTQA